MSYEHCEKHDCDATNGCPECATFAAKLDAELGAMRAIAIALEPLPPRKRAQALLAVALQFDPIPLDYEAQFQMLRVANGRGR